MKEMQKVINPYFGKWGGFFVPDPMTPALDDFASLTESSIADNRFDEQIQALLSGIVDLNVVLKPEGDSKKCYSTQSTALYYIIAGYALLAKISGRQLVCGVCSRDQALMVSKICQKASVSLGLWFDVATGSDENLIKDLEAGGVKVSLDQCRALFDDPDLYAFQKFVADPEHHLWASINTVTGPNPYPSLTRYFARFYADELLAAASKVAGKQSLKIVASGYPGFTMTGLLCAGPGKSVKLATFEPPVEKEREECYLGAYTKVALIGSKEFVLGPELVAAWESARLNRYFTCAPLQTFSEMKDAEIIVVVED
jgi:tryptophan synthase beta chain